MCFFGFLRAGEIVVPGDAAAVHLAHRVDSYSSSRPKRILFGKGSQAARRRICAVLAYMVTRGTGPGIFFRFQDGRSLTRERFVSVAAGVAYHQNVGTMGTYTRETVANSSVCHA